MQHPTAISSSARSWPGDGCCAGLSKTNGSILKRTPARSHPRSPKCFPPLHDFYVKIGQLDPDLTTDRAEYAKTMEIYAREAQPPFVLGMVPVEQWMDTSFRNEAIKRLGGPGWWRK